MLNDKYGGFQRSRVRGTRGNLFLSSFLSLSLSSFASDCSSSRFERALLETGRGTPPESCLNMYIYIFSNPLRVARDLFWNNNPILRIFEFLTTNRTLRLFKKKKCIKIGRRFKSFQLISRRGGNEKRM